MEGGDGAAGCGAARAGGAQVQARKAQQAAVLAHNRPACFTCRGRPPTARQLRGVGLQARLHMAAVPRIRAAMLAAPTAKQLGVCCCACRAIPRKAHGAEAALSYVQRQAPIGLQHQEVARWRRLAAALLLPCTTAAAWVQRGLNSCYCHCRQGESHLDAVPRRQRSGLQGAGLRQTQHCQALCLAAQQAQQEVAVRIARQVALQLLRLVSACGLGVARSVSLLGRESAGTKAAEAKVVMVIHI